MDLLYYCKSLLVDNIFKKHEYLKEIIYHEMLSFDQHLKKGKGYMQSMSKMMIDIET